MNTIQAQDLLSLKGQQYRKPWPKWAKLAAARFLHYLCPKFTATKWVACFESEDPFSNLAFLFEDGWFFGRLARCNVEMKQGDPKTFELMSKMKFVRDFNLKDGHLDIEHGVGLENLILDRVKETLQQSPELQKKFWQSFNQGFKSRLFSRPQDAKAGRIYMFLTLAWPLVERCTTIRELHEFVFRCIPREPCPPGVDPVDFDERQIKWFEKLCHRNLGLSLARRGRPAGKKIPQ